MYLITLSKSEITSLDSVQRLKLHAVGKNKLQSLNNTSKKDRKPIHDIFPQEHGMPQIYLEEYLVMQKQADV